MSKPSYEPNPTIEASQVLAALTQLVQRYVPLALAHTRLTAELIWSVVSYAAVHQVSLEGACQGLDHAPSGNRLREVLHASLPPLPVLQGQLNRLLRAQLPRPLLTGRRSYQLAADVTLIPYHGQPHQAADELVRGPSRGGTTHFHAYASLAIVHDRRRYVLAVRFVRAGQTLAQVLGQLLDRAQRLGVRIRRLLMDKGFYTVDVLRLLDRRRLSYIVPIPLRGQQHGIASYCRGRRSYATAYTLSSQRHEPYTVQAVLVRRYSCGRYGRRGAQWFAFAVAGLPAGMTPQQVYQQYRSRFGIETSYRQMNQVRARTASRRPAWRLLLVGLALALVNLYVALRACLATAPTTRAGRAGLSLPRLARLLAHAIEQRCGLAPVVQRRPSHVLS
jgi:putative transposase